ncbi:MAG: multiheme c-type cytochrome [Nitrospirota bacterium]
MKLTVVSIKIMFILLVLSAVSCVQGSKLRIIYTGSLQGQLEPCGCSPKSDFGGIARIAEYLAVHEEELSPYILIDAGNFSGEDTPQGKLKTEAMLKFLSSKKFDAVGYSAKEQVLKDDYFDLKLKEYEVPFVSRLSGYKRSVLLSRNGFDINVSADPEETATGKLNILLTDITVSDANDLQGWDVIVTSSGEETEGPLTSAETVIAAAYPKGKKIGILTLNKDDRGRINYKHRWQPTGNDILETDVSRTILDDYDSKVAVLMKEMDKPPPGTTYTGVDECTACHQPFLKQWENTRHASAFASLEEVGKVSDPECIACHVVGFRQTGGFFSIGTTPGLANVQCESCHGIGRKHLTDYSPMNSVTEMTCLKCHTEENSPEFDYPVYLEKIKH